MSSHLQIAVFDSRALLQAHGFKDSIFTELLFDTQQGILKSAFFGELGILGCFLFCQCLVGGQDEQTVGLQLSIFVFGDVGFPFKAKIRTILVNFPKGFLWYGISICFGMHDLTICIYHQLVMTYFLSLFGKDFWSKKLRSVFREWGKIENSLVFSCVFL